MIIFDIEIKAGPLPKELSDRRANVTYAASWTDYLGMGIAVIGCYDYMSDKYRVFGEGKSELDDFQQIIDSHDSIVGFNNNRFDNPLLEAHGVVIPAKKSYDILTSIYSALGSYQKGCGLDAVVKANFNSAGKTGSGAEAPILWQKGHYTQVIDYCLNDVRMTKMLLDRILRDGWINNPLNPGRKLYLPRPT